MGHGNVVGGLECMLRIAAKVVSPVNKEWGCVSNHQRICGGEWRPLGVCIMLGIGVNHPSVVEARQALVCEAFSSSGGAGEEGKTNELPAQTLMSLKFHSMSGEFGESTIPV